MLLAMINKEKHASVSWHMYGHLTRLVFDARSRHHFRLIGCIYSTSSFLRHLWDMLSLFPEKMSQVFEELGTKIGTQGLESLWACCLFYCCEGVQTVKRFPLPLWLGLAVGDRLSGALCLPVEARAAFEELLRALTGQRPAVEPQRMARFKADFLSGNTFQEMVSPKTSKASSVQQVHKLIASACLEPRRVAK